MSKLRGRANMADGAPSNHQFSTPEREVKNVLDLAKWKRSKAYRDLIGFINAINDAVKGKEISEKYNVSKAVQDVVSLLGKLELYVQEFPPCEQPQRFGNKAYRLWFDRVKEMADELVSSFLPTEVSGAATELSCYLTDSFGNSTRIDYGTGHEAAFLSFLCCLCKLRVLTETDYQAIGFLIFPRYLELVRKLLIDYRMEPAGSQGVWGLDDFHFMPYIWGSSQLIGHSNIEPSHIPDDTICQAKRDDFMFFQCIHFINSVKSGPFAEHSNTLWGISAVATWSKVNSGLIKMYKEEVLSKFPVVQHFIFGTLLSIDPV